MDFGLIIESIEGILCLIILISFVIAILQDKKLSGILIVFLFGIFGFLFFQSQQIFKEFYTEFILQKQFGITSWKMLAICFTIIIVWNLLDIPIKTEILYKDKEQQKPYAKNKLKQALIFLVISLLILGILFPFIR